MEFCFDKHDTVLAILNNWIASIGIVVKREIERESTFFPVV